MTDYHAPPTFDLATLPSVAALQRFLSSERPAEGTFEAFEQELGVLVRRVECEVKAEELSRYDVDAQVIVVAGMELRRCLEKEPKTYLSSSGPRHRRTEPLSPSRRR